MPIFGKEMSLTSNCQGNLKNQIRKRYFLDYLVSKSFENYLIFNQYSNWTFLLDNINETRSD